MIALSRVAEKWPNTPSSARVSSTPVHEEEELGFGTKNRAIRQQETKHLTLRLDGWITDMFPLDASSSCPVSLRSIMTHADETADDYWTGIPS